jgi:nucleotide-binding universal stress UspA family protein
MSYRTILAYVDESERCAALLSVARGLAERHQAHLVGLHVRPPIHIYPTAEIPMPLSYFEDQRAQSAQVAGDAGKLFEAAVKGAKFTHEWRDIQVQTSTIGETVARHGLACDLVITGQIDPEVESERRVGTPEQVLMHGGRPVLMVPYVGEYAHVGKRALVAWRASGESARAAFDALPLLRSSEKVTVLTIDRDDALEMPGVSTGADLAASLVRHGVKATARETVSGGMTVGDTLLARLSDDSDDLLVMGGYGHSRFSEYLFGGATRKVLQQMTVPVLLSH